jgi:hypothetical protein
MQGQAFYKPLKYSGLKIQKARTRVRLNLLVRARCTRVGNRTCRVHDGRGSDVSIQSVVGSR